MIDFDLLLSKMLGLLRLALIIAQTFAVAASVSSFSDYTVVARVMMILCEERGVSAALCSFSQVFNAK